MDSNEAQAFLAGLETRGIRLGLDAVNALLAALGDPQEGVKTVVVAGTNGKGSTAAMTASILGAAGYKTGLYTSPHLYDVTERIVVGGHQIEQETFNERLAEIKSVVDEMEKSTEDVPTQFEVLTAAAFLHFAAEGVDFAVLEVGLGGRLDATNVTTPRATIICDVGLDHQKFLGDTLEDIACEKAGVIKEHGTVVCAVGDPTAKRVIEETAREKGAKLIRVGTDITYHAMERTTAGIEGRITTTARTYDVFLPLHGSFQLRNAAAAVGAVDVLSGIGYRVPDEAVLTGLGRLTWPARIEVMQRKPLVVVDGAHNPAAMGALADAVKESFSYERLILVYGAMGYKDHAAMAAAIAPLANDVIATRASHPEAAEPRDLLRPVRAYTSNVSHVDGVQEAVTEALSKAGANDLVLVAGSLAVAAEARRRWKKTVEFP